LRRAHLIVYYAFGQRALSSANFPPLPTIVISRVHRSTARMANEENTAAVAINRRLF
jgi:hypothetical protein